MKHVIQRLLSSKNGPPRPPFKEIVWSSAGCFLGVGLCALLSSLFFEPRDLTLLIGSFGASSILIYGVVASPFSQPRNLVGGHIVSALMGVAAYRMFPDTVVIAGALAAGLAMAAMFATRTVHPPGGATALIAVIGGDKIHALGFLYPLIPAGAGALVLLAVALSVNRLNPRRKYPDYWW